MHDRARGLGDVREGAGGRRLRERVCDGDGAVTEVDDDGDVRDDHSECTVDSCRDGSPINDPVETGTWCALADGGLCNPAGVCVQCLTDWDCPTGVCADYVRQAPRARTACATATRAASTAAAAPARRAERRPGVTSVDYPVIAVGGAPRPHRLGFTGATGVTVDLVPQPFMIDSDTQITIPALSNGTPIGPADMVVNRPAARWTSFRGDGDPAPDQRGRRRHAGHRRARVHRDRHGRGGT